MAEEFTPPKVDYSSFPADPNVQFTPPKVDYSSLAADPQMEPLSPDQMIPEISEANQNYTGITFEKQKTPPALLRENAPQIEQDMWNQGEGGEPQAGPLREQPLRPDVGHATGIRQNIGVGFGLGLDATMANVVSLLSQIQGGPEEQGTGMIERPDRAQIYNATLTALNKFMMIDKLEPPGTLADAIARGAGESVAPIAETMALSPVTAGILSPLAAGIAQKMPYLYSWLFPVARDAMTFGTQAALEPNASARNVATAAGGGAAFGLLGPYGRVVRAAGGAGIGVAQEYLSNPEAGAMDYARNAALMAGFAAIGSAHGMTAEEAAVGTILDWAKGRGYTQEAIARSLQINGLGPLADEFQEDVTSTSTRLPPAEEAFPEAFTSKIPAFIRGNMEQKLEGAQAFPTVEKTGAQGMRTLAEDLGFKSTEDLRVWYPAFTEVYENSRYADVANQEKFPEQPISQLIDYAKKAGPDAMRQVAEDLGYDSADKMLAAYAGIAPKTPEEIVQTPPGPTIPPETGQSAPAPGGDNIVMLRNVGPDTTETVREMADRIANVARPGWWKGIFRWVEDGLTLDPVPRMAKIGNWLADKAVEHASARIAAPKMVANLLSSVFPDSYHDPEAMAKTIDILVKDNVLAGYDQFMDRAEKARGRGDVEAADRWTEAAGLIAQRHDLGKYDADVRAARDDPAIAGNIDRWIKYVSGPEGTLTRLYNEVKGLDPDTEQSARGKHFGARINLTTLERAAKIAEIAGDGEKTYHEPQIGAQYRNLNVGGYKNPEVGPDPYDRAAAFTGEYSTDARLNLLSALGPRLNEATKLRFYTSLIESGAALPWDAEDPGTIQGVPATRLEMEIPQTPVFEDGSKGQTQYINRNMYVRDDIAGEIRRVLATDMRLPQNPMARAVTFMQVAQAVDLAAHLQNILSVITRAQGAGSVWTDIVRKVPVLGRADAAGRIFSVMREVMEDGPAIRDEIAQMAEQGNIRAEHPPDWFQKITHGQQLIHAVDTGTRVLMNRFFDNLVERGLAIDNDANRRGYLNQVGMYNRRLMGPWMQALMDSGATPFVVAGRNFNLQGIRGITLNPGVQAANVGAALQMRFVNGIGAALTASVIPMILNTLTTGSPMGRPGTPVGAWDLGRAEDEKGSHQALDLLGWIGVRRGMRALGLDALIEGMRAGHTADQISKDAATQALQTWAHPWTGPFTGFMARALGGFAPDVRGKMEAEQYPGKFWKQRLENVRAAAKSMNAPFYALQRPAWQALGFDQDDKTPYYSNFTKTFLKGPAALVAVRDAYPPQSAALKMALEVSGMKASEGYRPGEADIAAAKRQIKILEREGKPIPPELSEQLSRGQQRYAQRAGNMTPLEEAYSRINRLGDAIQVLEVASPEETQDLYRHTARLVNSAQAKAAQTEAAQKKVMAQIDQAQELLAGKMSGGTVKRKQ